MNMHELVPYLRDGNIHDFGHDIHELTFIGDDEFVESKATKSKALKVKLGIDSNPLDGVMRRVRFIAFTCSPLLDVPVIPGNQCTVYVPVLPESRFYSI